MHLDLPSPGPAHSEAARVVPTGNAPKTPYLHSLNSPFYLSLEENTDYLSHHGTTHVEEECKEAAAVDISDTGLHLPEKSEVEAGLPSDQSSVFFGKPPMRYTTDLRSRPPKTFLQNLKPWNGRLSKSNWFLVMLRPFVLFGYPSILWSTLVYSLSVGWLIVLS